jgi:hypothetical protein
MHLRSVAPLTFTVAAVAVVAFLMPSLGEALQYDRAAMLDGQWWRAVTGHMVHWSGEHLFWDVAMFVVLGWVLERCQPRQFAVALIAAAGAISAVPTSKPLGSKNPPDPVGSTASNWLASVLPVVLLIGLTAKIGYEYATGATLFVGSDAAFTPVPLAHLIGATVGLATACVSRQHNSLALAP